MRQQVVLELRCAGTHWSDRRVYKGDKNSLQVVHEDDAELHAWNILEESDSEQWQDVSNKEHLTLERLRCFELQENHQCQDKRVKIRVTLDTGVAGHVMFGTLFPNMKKPVKLFL